MDEHVDRTETETPTLSRPAPRRRWRWLWLLLLLIAVGVGVVAWRDTHPASQPAAKSASGAAATPPQPVGAAAVDKGDIRIVLNELGTVIPLANVTVKTQISGQLMAVGFQEGQMVKKGDFLAQVDDRPYQVQLEKDQGQLAHDQGLLDQAQADLKRFQTLGRQDSIAQQQVDDQRFLVQQDQGLVKVDQGAIDNDRLNIAYCHIIAPVSGRVGLRQVDPGNYVQMTDVNGIVVLTQLDPISAIFTVTEDSLPQVMQRLGAGATLPVDAYDRSNTTKLATGQIAAVDNQINTTTGTVNIRATFSNPKDVLFPNQFINARLLVDTLSNVTRVPVAAVQQGAPGAFVYVINADSTVSVKTVKLGVTDGPLVQVLSGLSPGDRVVTDGTDRLRDGAKVTVPAAQGKPTGTPGAAPAPAAPAATTPAPAAPGAARQRGQQGQ
jgi:multidrug efflux system membrane fusion protein